MRTIAPPKQATLKSANLPGVVLSDAELVDLTRYTRPSFQIRELRRLRIPFRIAADGHPIVARVAAERVLIGKIAGPTEPDFTALEPTE